MPRISSIVYQPLDSVYEDRRVDFLRVPAGSARLIADHGIEGDRKAARGGGPRQLNVLSAEWLAARAAEGYRAAPGQFGEQIIIDGLAVETLPPGTHIALGPEAIIAISKGRSGCDRLQAAQPLPTGGLGAIGAMARVVMGGPIAVGDEVRVLEAAAA